MTEHIDGTEEWAREVQPPHISHWTRAPHHPKWCCASVPEGGRSVGFRQCSRKPTTFYGELGYCHVHDPKAVVKRQRDRRQQWAIEADANRARMAEADRVRKRDAAALQAIREIAKGHNDPRSLAIAVLTEAGEWP